MSDTRPIYEYTYFMQRCKTQTYFPGEPEKMPKEENNGYRILPGCKVRIWFYNTALERYVEATDYRSGTETDKDPNYSTMEFWEPNEYMSHKVRRMLREPGSAAATAALLLDINPGDMNCREDIVKIKFVNDNKMPPDSNGNPYPSGMYASTDQDNPALWSLESIAGGS